MGETDVTYREIPQRAEDARPLKEGDSIPAGAAGSLRDRFGKKVDLGAEIRKRPTVLVFYRGGWCPYCGAQLGKLAGVESRLAAMGYQLLAVSPDRPEKLRESAEKQHIHYTLLSDSSMETCRAFGLAFRADGKALEHYHDDGPPEDSGEGPRLLPVPAAYVVDRQGKIHFAYANPDYKVRVDEGELLAAAEKALRPR